jgi:phosphohistidine phosphatase
VPTLLLLRHAKSSWDDPGLRDHDRPLSERGERSAAAMGAYLRQQGTAPDLVLCSSARRTVDTLTGVRPGLPKGVAVDIDRAVYEVDAAALLDRLRQVPDSVGTLLVIGHNPGLEDLATKLSGPDSDPGARKALGRKFPTGGFASLVFDGDWHGLDWNQARLTGFVAPKDLV